MEAIHTTRHPVKETLNAIRSETDRSLILRSMQRIMRPFHNQLMSDSSHIECVGSAKLKVPSHVSKNYCVKEEYISKVYTYNIHRKHLALPEKTPLHRIMYFVGGGFRLPPSTHHWRFMRRLLDSISDDTIISMVSYPLAPENTAPTTIPLLLNYFKVILEEAKSTQTKVTIAGDSAGANIAVSLVLEMLKQDPQALVPVAILLISPAVDLAHENPGLKKVERIDPLLRLKVVKDIGRAYAGDWDVATDSRVSPIHAQNLGDLKDRNVAVYGLTSSADILSPDAVIFRDRLLKEGVMGRWLEWEGKKPLFLLV